MTQDDIGAGLSAWLSAHLDRARDVTVGGLDRVELGHSAEMLTLTVSWSDDHGPHRRDVVVRLRPVEPGLLEPYDLQRQYDVLSALAATDVRVPPVLWIEPTGSVLGRPFFVMARVDGRVYEQDAPEDADAARIRRMAEGFVDQLAAIHRVDLDATGLRDLGDGDTYVDRELTRWSSDVRRVQAGPLPAFERLGAELTARRPAQTPAVTLVHGDAKPGNFAFVGDEVSAVFDWELVDVGDPLADLGYAEVLWSLGIGLAGRPGALTADELVARWSARTGVGLHDRDWYRALAAYKLAAIMVLGSMLVDAGHSDDVRLARMGFAVPIFTGIGLRALGVGDEIENGPTTARPERLAAIGAL